MLVSILVPNWNGKDNTPKLLDSLEKIDFPLSQIEIIISDNGSSDGSLEWLKDYSKKTKKFKRVLVVENGDNIGAPAAYNRALSVIHQSSDFVWKVDNDIVVEEDSLSKMLESFEQNKNLGLIGSAVFPLFDYINLAMNRNGLCEIGCKVNYFTTIVSATKITDSERSDLMSKNCLFKELTYPIGCSNLIPTQLIQKIGGFDKDFFLYYDDTYFAYEVKKLGYDIATSLDSIVYHKGSASTGGVFKPLGIYYATLSELKFFYKVNKFFWWQYPSIVLKRLLLTIWRTYNKGTLSEALKKYVQANKEFIKFTRA